MARILKKAGVERQKAGGQLEGDFDPPLTEDHQIADFSGGLKPSWATQKGVLCDKIFPPALCPLPPASPEGLLISENVTHTSNGLDQSFFLLGF